VLISMGFRVFGSVRKQADADRLQREFGNGFVPLLMDITDSDAQQRLAKYLSLQCVRNSMLEDLHAGYLAVFRIWGLFRCQRQYSLRRDSMAKSVASE
jgi:hypothetical protein